MYLAAVRALLADRAHRAGVALRAARAPALPLAGLRQAPAWREHAAVLANLLPGPETAVFGC